MATFDEMDEIEGVDENEQIEKPEVEVEKGDVEEHFSRDDLRESAFAEGIEDSVLESLASKDSITIEDLRSIPGSEGLTDEQLTAAWTKAQADAGIEGGPEVQAADTKVELPFPVYDAAGNKIAADKVTLGDLLSGKALVGYNAMGKEQRKALNEVIRNASQGHWNEHRYNTAQEQYRQSHQRATTAETKIKQFEEQQGQWNAALTALVMGDNNPMKALVEAYRSQMGKSTGITPEGFVPRDQVEQQAAATERGMQWYNDVGLPSALDIADRYGANAKEVMGAIKYFIENEPVLTPERIDEILKYDVPMAFEQNGYVAKGGTQNAGPGTQAETPNEVEALKKQVEALTQRLAGTANARTEAVRAKGKRIPPAGSGATSGAGDSMPAFKSRESMKEWLRS